MEQQVIDGGYKRREPREGEGSNKERKIGTKNGVKVCVEERT